MTITLEGDFDATVMQTNTQKNAARKAAAFPLAIVVVVRVGEIKAIDPSGKASVSRQ